MSFSPSSNQSIIGINGFGRIGRLISRVVLTEQADAVQIGLINEPFMSTAYMAYLLKHDSTHSSFPGTVVAEGTSLKITVAGCGRACTCVEACACNANRTVTIATCAFKVCSYLFYARILFLPY